MPKVWRLELLEAGNETLNKQWSPSKPLRLKLDENETAICGQLVPAFSFVAGRER